MNNVLWDTLASVGTLAAIVSCVESGRRFGLRRLALAPDPNQLGLSAVDGAIFGLMGLLMAFAFSGALTRWDTRREQIVAEANAIGTAWLRIDLLPTEAQPPLRDLFRNYLDVRLAAYRDIQELEKENIDLRHTNELQTQIWKLAVTAAQGTGTPAASVLVVPALNEMFDLAATRAAAPLAHPPVIVYGLLFVLILASAFVAGNAMASIRLRPWMHVIAFATALALTIYVIIDIEYPRAGFMRIDFMDDLLLALRKSMN